MGEADRKMNEAVGINFFNNRWGREIVSYYFKKKEFWKCIGCVMLTGNYGKKVHKLWSELPKASCMMEPTKLQRYFCGNTHLYKVCCDH